jgi:hypothetical protein
MFGFLVGVLPCPSIEVRSIFVLFGPDIDDLSGISAS